MIKGVNKKTHEHRQHTNSYLKTDGKKTAEEKELQRGRHAGIDRKDICLLDKHPPPALCDWTQPNNKSPNNFF